MAEALTLRSRALDVQVSTGLRPAAERVHLRALRPVRQHVPDRGARTSAPPRAAAAPRTWSRSAPRAPIAASGCQMDLNVNPQTEPHRARHERAGLRAERRQPVRQGALRVPVRPFARAPDQAADPRERRLPRGVVGRGARARRQAADGNPRRGTARTASRSSVPAAARTRRTTSCRSWRARPAGRTTSTSARPPATRRPSPAWPWRFGSGAMTNSIGEIKDVADAVPHRREPHRGPPDHRLGDEEGAAPRREAHRLRSRARPGWPAAPTSTSSTSRAPTTSSSTR